MKLKKLLIGISLASLAVFGVVGCSDDDDDPITGGTPSNPTAMVRVVHASYDAPGVDIAVDGNVAIPNLGYGIASIYYDIEAGTRNIKVTPKGQTSPVVIEADLNLEANKSYTVFAVDELSSIAPVVAEDNRAPVSNKAKVRFLHASPDAPAVDIRLNDGSGPVVFGDNSFRDLTSYTEVDPGDYSFVVTGAGSTTEVVAFSPINVSSGRSYTVVAIGTLDANDQYPFTVRVFIDNDLGNLFSDLTLAKTDLRVIHTSYDAPAVDIALDDNVAISNLPYGLSSGYAGVDYGMRNVKVTPSGASSPVVIEADLNLTRNMSYTVVAVDELSSISPIVMEDSRTPASNKAKVRFLHASPDAPAVDIRLNDGSGAVVFGNQAFEDYTGYAEIDAGDYTFAVTPAGDTTEVIIFQPIGVQNGTVYTVVAHGTLDNTDQYPFAVRVFIDNDPGDGYADLSATSAEVMVVHASPDAPGVDLLVDGLVVNSSALEFPNNTGYLGVTGGDRNIKVNASGTPTTVIDANLNLDPNINYSVFAVNNLASIEPLVVVDDLTAPASGKAHVRFMHLSPNAPAVDITLTDGTVVFGDYEFKEYTAFTPLDAASYDLQVRLQGTSTVVLDLPGIVLEDGKIYTVFARGLVGGAGDQALNAEIIVNN